MIAKSRVAQGIAVAIIAGATATAFGLSIPAGEERNRAEAPRVSVLNASYPVYGSLRKIAVESTLVVRGTVEKALPSFRVIPTGVQLAKLPPAKRENVGYLMTDAVVRVDKVFAGPATMAGRHILVAHLGGEDGRDKFVAEGETISQPGHAYVFFLRKAPGGRYVIVGGGQGRFSLDGGKLSPVSEHVTETPVARQLAGMTSAAFDRDFKRLTTSK
jgi:hypothetical protein